MAGIDLTQLLKDAIDNLTPKDIPDLTSEIATGLKDSSNISNPISQYRGRIIAAIEMLENFSTQVDFQNYQWNKAEGVESKLKEIAVTRAKLIVGISQAYLLVQEISDKLQSFTEEEAFAFVTIEDEGLKIYSGPIKELLTNSEFLATLSIGRYAKSRGGALKLNFSQASLNFGKLQPLSFIEGYAPNLSAISKQVSRHYTTRSFVLEGYARSAILGKKYRFRQDSNPFYGEADIQGTTKKGEFVRYSVKTFKNYNTKKKLANVSASLVDIKPILAQLNIYKDLAQLNFKLSDLSKAQLEDLVSNKSADIKQKIIEHLRQKVSN